MNTGDNDDLYIRFSAEVNHTKIVVHGFKE